MSGPPEFHHLDDGTPEDAWASTPGLSGRPVLELAGIHHLVVVAAHPDDETLMAGGLLFDAHRLGITVDVVVATDGEASHPHSPTHTAHALVALRREEVAAAISHLAPSAGLHCPGLGDGRLAEGHDVLVRLLVDLVGTRGEGTLLVSTWRGDGHPDHEAAALAAASAAWRTDARLLECPIWFWHWGSPGDSLPAGPCLPLAGDAHAAKSEAMRAHHSQVDPLSDAHGDEAILGAPMLAHFHRDIEVFFDGEVGETNPFESLHASDPDPWRVRSSWYEARKRAVTLAALPRPRYGRVLEVGCSVGALAADLAGRADHVLAVDESAAALRRAGEALDGVPNVSTQRLRVPEELPVVDADLVVISEIGYFLSPLRLRDLARRVAASGRSTVVACHWRHDIIGWPLDGPAVHAILRGSLGMPTAVLVEDVDFVLEVFSTDAGAEA
ncbi:MAG: bifunctional PIG-L family deacetylase/class I SAM-dependent methyltransferase [Arachnia sp.]